jgi:hypothetical protein
LIGEEADAIALGEACDTVHIEPAVSFSESLAAGNRIRCRGTVRGTDGPSPLHNRSSSSSIWILRVEKRARIWYLWVAGGSSPEPYP